MGEKTGRYRQALRLGWDMGLTAHSLPLWWPFDKFSNTKFKKVKTVRLGVSQQMVLPSTIPGHGQGPAKPPTQGGHPPH